MSFIMYKTKPTWQHISKYNNLFLPNNKDFPCRSLIYCLFFINTNAIRKTFFSHDSVSFRTFQAYCYLQPGLYLLMVKFHNFWTKFSGLNYVRLLSAVNYLCACGVLAAASLHRLYCRLGVVILYYSVLTVVN